MIFHCEGRCGATFAHPDETDCETIEGECEHLYSAGWRAVLVRITLYSRLLLTRGGWLCPACLKRYH